MSLPNLNYSIVAEDEFSRIFDRLERQVSGSDRAIEQMNRSLARAERQASVSTRGLSGLGQTSAGLGSALSGIGRGLVGGALGGIAAIGAREVIQFADATARLSTANKRTSEAFELLSGSTENATAKLNAVRSASGGAIDDISAMQIANKAAALGFASTASELERVTKFATTTGRLLGVDTVTALDNIAAATANLSFVRLDQMGVSASQVRERFNELKGTMSESEAFLQATLEVGERTFSTLADSSLTAASGMERLSAQLANIKNALAQPIGSGVDSFAGFLATVLGNPTNIDQRFQQGIAQVEQNIEFSSQYSGLGAVTERDQKKLEILNNIRDAAELANETLAKGGLPPEAIEQITQYRDELVNAGSVIADLPELPADEVQTQIAQMVAAITGLRIAWGVTKAELESPISDERRAERQGDIQSQIDEQLRATRAVSDAQFELALATTDTAGQILLYEAQLSRLEEGTVGYINTQTQIARLQGRIADQTERAGSSFIGTLGNLESAFNSALSAIGGIPGFSGRTAVTEDDIRLSRAGLYRDKPDEFLRRAEDLLMNGTQRGDVSRDFIERAVAASTGFDVERLGTLANDLLFKLLEEEFTSARLFGTDFGQANLDELLNQQAIAFGLQQQGQANLGKQFLETQFQSGALPGIFANAGGFAGQLDQQLQSAGFANQVGGIFNKQLTSDEVLGQVERAMPTIGNTLQNAILGDFEGRNIGYQLVLMLLAQMQNAEAEVTQ